MQDYKHSLAIQEHPPTACHPLPFPPWLQEVLRRDQTFFDHETKGALVSRLTLDVATLQATLADLLGQRGLRSLLEVAGPMIIIATKHPLMAVSALPTASCPSQGGGCIAWSLLALCWRRDSSLALAVFCECAIVTCASGQGWGATVLLHALQVITCAVTPLLSRALRSVVVRSTELSYQRQRVASEALEFASDRLTHVQTVQVGRWRGRGVRGAYIDLHSPTASALQLTMAYPLTACTATALVRHMVMAVWTSCSCY